MSEWFHHGIYLGLMFYKNLKIINISKLIISESIIISIYVMKIFVKSDFTVHNF